MGFSSKVNRVDPFVIRFGEQKRLAKNRGIGWELEYWEWRQIWDDSGHLHERGTRKGEWVMSRKGDKGPYSFANVRIVRAETNIIERHFPDWKPTCPSVQG